MCSKFKSNYWTVTDITVLSACVRNISNNFWKANTCLQNLSLNFWQDDLQLNALSTCVANLSQNYWTVTDTTALSA